jgi:hypothetical protein
VKSVHRLKRKPEILYHHQPIPCQNRTLRGYKTSGFGKRKKRG